MCYRKMETSGISKTGHCPEIEPHENKSSLTWKPGVRI